MTTTVPLGVASARAARPDEIRARVQGIERAAEGVVTLELAAADGTSLPPWQPGAHVDVHLPSHVRQYSLCGDPADRGRYRIGVLHEPSGRGGSAYVHTRLRAGDTLMLSQPRNRFPLVNAERYLFLAGGIGITPLLPMLAELEERNAPWTLHYGGRTRATMAFLGELGRYGDRVRAYPQDGVGLLPVSDLLDAHGPGAVYCCGPEPLLAAAERGCGGRPGVQFHVERFTASTPAGALPRRPFEVHCQESGVTVQVSADESILDALLAAGIDASYDCREGTCGTCELDLVSGEAEHLDSVYPAGQHDEQGVIFPCVSRARCPRLVLDI